MEGTTSRIDRLERVGPGLNVQDWPKVGEQNHQSKEDVRYERLTVALPLVAVAPSKVATKSKEEDGLQSVDNSCQERWQSSPFVECG